MHRAIWAAALVLPLTMGAVALLPKTIPAAAATHRVSASMDTSTSYEAKNTRHGAAHHLFTSGRNRAWRHTFLQFRLPTLTVGETITGATLRLYASVGSAGAGPDVYTTRTGWQETDVTWNAAPARGTWLGRKGGYAAANWVQFDVIKGVSSTSSNIDVAFRLESNEPLKLLFESRENASGRGPQLVLTTSITPSSSSSPTRPTTDPTATPTTPATDGTQAAVLNRWGAVVAGDEFNYVGVPNQAKWKVYNSPGHGGNGLRKPSQVAVNGVRLRISGTAAGTTGGMSAKFDRRKYGRWETRMKVSARDPEYHPVLILWPDSGNWPCDGEIDYAEGTGNPQVMNFFHHYSCDNRQTHAGKTLDATQWHNYAVEWTDKAIVGYLDGVEWFRDSNPSHQPPGPMHQTIQLDWFPDGTTTTPTTMDVDWVRVYNVSSATATPTSTTSPTVSPSPTATTSPTAPAADVRIAAVGDMNSVRNVSTKSPSGKNGAAISAALAEGSIDAFFGLGDFQYSTAYCADYVNYWRRLWGGTKARLYWVSAPNHDWKPGRNEDLDNFMNGQCPGDTSKSAINTERGFIGNGDPYSRDFGNWHVAFLSSALWRYDTTRANQVTTWLDNDLAAAKAQGKHLAVVYHEPYFTSDTSSHTRASDHKPWIDVMYKHRVRLTLSGSQHNYERSCPVDNADRCVADGMTAFQVSTGGVTLRPFTSSPRYIAKRFSDTHGWLHLTLKADGSFRWDYRPVQGTSTDAGLRPAG